MKVQLTKLALMVIFSLFSVAGFSKGTITGKVIDSDSHESLVGASVALEGTTTGAITETDGTFKLRANAGTYNVVFSFIGYLKQEKQITVKEGQTLNVGTIGLQPDAVGIDEISVFASLGVQRKTPVAISTIDANLVAEKLGNEEFPEIMESTPGVYATKRGGGYGDSRVNIRGFSSENVAVMINGVPVNDMEWGGVYWSNWMGMQDVLRTMQIQRGLGASKVAVPSVGGSVNIVTKTTDAKKGGSFSTSYGNDGYHKMMFTVSSGLTNDGWAFTLQGSKTDGDGYIMGTEFQGYSYFMNVSKKINDKHTIAFTGFGAPQWHNQRSSYDKFTIEEWQTKKDKYKYNATFGYGQEGERVNGYRNFYHKPMFMLNDYWTISDKSNLSTSLYYSFGQGGGYTQLGNEKSWLYGSDDTYRTVNGYKDYAAIQEYNAGSTSGSQAVIGTSDNDHQWMGVISTYTTQLGSYFDLYGGVDLRYYVGNHDKKIENLLGGKFFIDPTRADVSYLADDQSYQREKLGVGDVVGRNYSGHVARGGVFGQIEYNKNDLSVTYSGSVSNTSYWRYDRMYYAPGNRKSDTKSFIGWSSKAGANYNIDSRNNVFVNAGYFSRAPFFSSVFLADDVSNVINNDAKNEKVYSGELGYGFHSRLLSVKLNGYYTFWKDKTLAGAIDSQDPSKGSYNATGVDAIHKGVEMEVTYKPIRNLKIGGMLSLGDWRWDNNVNAYAQNDNGQLVDSKGDVVSDPADAYQVNLKIHDVHVGDAAQTTAHLGVSYKFWDSLNVGLNYDYHARLYAAYYVDDLDGNDTWKVPGAGVLDANAQYHFTINGMKATLSGNVHNLLDKVYISDADDGSSHTWTDATVFYGFGRTGSVALKIYF